LKLFRITIRQRAQDQVKASIRRTKTAQMKSAFAEQLLDSGIIGDESYQLLMKEFATLGHDRLSDFNDAMNAVVEATEVKMVFGASENSITIEQLDVIQGVTFFRSAAGTNGGAMEYRLYQAVNAGLKLSMQSNAVTFVAPKVEEGGADTVMSHAFSTAKRSSRGRRDRPSRRV
jgi:hypothetical protein